MTVSILIGDVFVKLAELPNDHFDSVVTSPPYWGLRDYDVDGQIGLEPTLGEHLDVMVRVFREVRRVMKPTGTLWLNYGDCYAGSWGAQSRDHAGKHAPNVSALSANQVKAAQKRANTGSLARTPGLKPKDLCMVPNRLAIALQEDGWWVRSEIIWAKPNPMPENVYDRPSSAHEKIWLLTKGRRYFYDHEAVREPVTGGAHARRPGPNSRAHVDRVPGTRKAAAPGQRIKNNSSFDAALDNHTSDTRNARNIWTMAPSAFSEAHFATFPPELAERCILAGSPSGGSVLDPFGGAGTTGLVAARLGRSCTLIELNPKYARIAERRLRAGLAQVEGPPSDDEEALPLFKGAAA